MSRIRGTKLAAAVLLVMAAAGVQAGTTTAAQAAFPGANGKIYYEDDTDGDFEIYSMNPDATGITKLTDNTAADRYAVASADGKKVAFLSDRAGTNVQVWTMNADGTNPVQVTTSVVSSQGLAWSPTGQIIYADGTNQDLMLINSDGTGVTDLGVKGTFPDVSPDGSKIAYVGQDGNAWTIEANGANNTEVITYSSPISTLYTVEWSPDGTKLAVSAFDVFAYFHLMVANADGSNLTGITSGPGQIVPQWAPDSTKIAYTEVFTPTTEFHLINPDGTGDTLLYTTASTQDAVSDWAPVPTGPVYNFLGWFQPVDNMPTFNSLKAGSAVPIKFKLGGDQGLNVIATGYPTSGTIPYNSTELIDPIEQTVTANASGLQYDAATDQYTYVWKTSKAWAGTSRQFVMKLADGTYHRANFYFN